MQSRGQETAWVDSPEEPSAESPAMAPDESVGLDADAYFEAPPEPQTLPGRAGDTLPNARAAAREDVTPLDGFLTGSRRAHQRAKNRARIKALTVALIVVGSLLFVETLSGLIYVSLVNRENNRLRQMVTDMDRAVAEAEARTEALEAQRDVLLAGRIPGLRVLDYDRTLYFDTGYVKNVLFTLTGSDEARSYEFTAKLENARGSVLWPEVEIVLFDERGVQVGRTLIGAPPGTETARPLAPAETRRFHGQVAVAAGAVPRYFALGTPERP